MELPLTLETGSTTQQVTVVGTNPLLELKLRHAGSGYP